MATVKTSPRFKPRDPWSKDTGKITTQTGETISYKKPSYKLVEDVESTLIPTTEVLEIIEPRKSIGSLTGINANHPAFKNRVSYVEDFFKNNKMETLDDLGVLISNLRSPEKNKLLTKDISPQSMSEGKFPAFEGDIKDMGSNIRIAIKHSSLKPKMKTKYSDQVSKILHKKAIDVSHASSLENSYQTFKNSLYNMMPRLEAGERFIDAYDKVVGTTKTTRSEFRGNRWERWKDRLAKEESKLHAYFEPIIKLDKEVKEVRQQPKLVEKGDYADYKYIGDFTLKGQPEAYKILKMFRSATKKDNPGLFKINKMLQFLQGHPASDLVSKGGFSSSIKHLASMYEMIPPKLFVDKIRYPNYLQTPRMNTIQSYIELGQKGEKGFLDNIVERWNILGHYFVPFGKEKAGGTWKFKDPGKFDEGQLNKIKELDGKIGKAIEKMNEYGIEVQFYSPVKKDIVSWGKKDYSWRELVSKFQEGKRKEGGYIQSSLVSVDEVLNGIY